MHKVCIPYKLYFRSASNISSCLGIHLEPRLEEGYDFRLLTSFYTTFTTHCHSALYNMCCCNFCTLWAPGAPTEYNMYWGAAYTPNMLLKRIYCPQMGMSPILGSACSACCSDEML